MWGQPPGCPAGQRPAAHFTRRIREPSSPCHAERSSEDHETILTAKSKHPYPPESRHDRGRAALLGPRKAHEIKPGFSPAEAKLVYSVCSRCVESRSTPSSRKGRSLDPINPPYSGSSARHADLSCPCGFLALRPATR